MGGPGKGAFFISEQLTFQQGFGNGNAVDHQKGPVRPGTVLVQRAGHQLLSRSGLSADQHGGVGGRYPADGLVHLLHGGALADDGLPAGFSGMYVDFDRISHETAGLQGLLDHIQHVGDLERLQHIVERPLANGFDSRIGGAVCGHDDHRQLGVDLVDDRKGLQAADARQFHVQNRQVRSLFTDDFNPLLTGARGQDPVALIRQKPLETFPELVIVVDDTYGAFHFNSPSQAERQ